MDEIIKQLGVSDGFFIPVADDDNKKLELEIKELQKQREQLSSELDGGKARLTTVGQYVDNLQRETQENLKLLYAIDNEIRIDDSNVKLTKGQVRSLAAEKKEIQKNLQDVKNRQDNFGEDSSRVATRLEQLRVQVNWDQSALQAWSNAASKVGEDAAMLEQFSQQDREKFEHLELKRRKLREEVGGKRQKFEAISGEILNLELSLEKISNLFQNQHNERRALVDQWRSATQILQQRDEDIHRAMNEIGGLRAQGKQRTRELQEQKQFYENELRNNRELEREAAKLGRESRETVDDIRRMEAIVSDLHGQFLVARGALTTTARQVEVHRSSCRQMSQEILKKRAQCQKFEKLMENLHKMILESQTKKMSSEDRVDHLEDIKNQENVAFERLIQEQTKLQEKVRMISEELLRLKGIEKEQRGRMTGLEAALQNFKQRAITAQTHNQKQQDILYKSEMLLLEKELDYKRMIGQTSPDETERLEKKFEQLDKIYKETKETNQLLEREVYRLDQEYRRLVMALETDERDLKTLRAKRQELILQADGGEKRLNQLRAANQDNQVDENVVRLRVSHLEKALQRVGSKIYSLERQKLELEEAVKERGMEVEALLDVLSVRKRALQEQLSNLNASINAANTKVEQLQIKYDLHMQSLGDCDGETMTVTKLKIQAAQERFELQQMGDKLDAKIRKTEKEITAMENTLQAVCAANCSYKSSLSRVPADGPELQEKENLEESLIAALEIIQQKKTTLQDLQEATGRLQDDFQNQLETEAALLKDAANRANDISDLNRRLSGQNDKQSRAARDLRLLFKQIHGINQQFQTFEEKDIELREIRDQNQSALQQLGETAGQILEASPVIMRYLRERGLTLPQPSSRKTSSSRASSISARSSCYTIDSSNLPDTVQKTQKRHSILRQSKPKSSSHAGSIDIVDLVVPQPK